MFCGIFVSVLHHHSLGNSTKSWTTTFVKVDGSDEISEITSTPGHKYYLPFNDENRNPNEVYEHDSYEELSVKWVSACNLKKGDKVLLSDGKYGIIIKVETKVLDEPETTYNFEVADFHTYYVGEKGILTHNTGNCGGRAANKLKPDSNAQGAHSTFRRDPTTGKITHYATYEPNPLNPTGFDEVLRFDGIGGAHTNKITLLDIPTPHIHGKSIPGGVGIPELWQLPKGY